MTISPDGSFVSGPMIGHEMKLPFGFLAESIGFPELFIVFLVVLLLFGPKRLPEIARMLGRASSELSRSLQEFKREISRASSEAGEPAGSVEDEQQPSEQETDNRENKTGNGGGHAG